MRQKLRPCAVFVFMVAVGLQVVQGVPAQEATPSQGTAPAGDAAPMFLESLGSEVAAEAPGKRLMLFRLTIAPGGSSLPHKHPGQMLVSVESGTLAYLVIKEEGELVWGRSGTPTTSEPIPAGTEITFGPGEFFVEPRGQGHVYHNPGDEPVVLLISALVDADGTLFEDVESVAATPAG